MKKYLFKKIDAFATGKSSGNPAACVYLEKPSDISEIEMQQIAFELKGFIWWSCYYPHLRRVFSQFLKSISVYSWANFPAVITFFQGISF